MKYREEDTIASPEEEVRLRIYDGDIPLENAGVEILRMLIGLKGQARRNENAAYLLLKATENLVQMQGRPWWRKLLNLPPQHDRTHRRR